MTKFIKKIKKGGGGPSFYLRFLRKSATAMTTTTMIAATTAMYVSMPSPGVLPGFEVGLVFETDGDVPVEVDGDSDEVDGDEGDDGTDGDALLDAGTTVKTVVADELKYDSSPSKLATIV